MLNGGSHRTPEEISGLREVIDMVERHQARIVTSEIVLAEVLDDADQLERLMKQPAYFMVSPAGPILRRVRELRGATRQAGRSLKTPDATYLATALAYHAEALHTFDGPLLGLSGLSCIDGVKICKPRGDQTTLGF